MSDAAQAAREEASIMSAKAEMQEAAQDYERLRSQALAQERTQMLHIPLQLQNRTDQFRRTIAAWTQASRAAVRRGDLDTDAELSAALLHWRLQAGAATGRRTGARVGG